MPTPHEVAVETLWVAQKAAAGVAVTYVQGATSVSLTGVPGRSLTEQESADGVVRTARVADFVFKQSELGLTPRITDTITWGSRKFAVQNPPGGRHFETVGQFSNLTRVHTKEVNAS